MAFPNLKPTATASGRQVNEGDDAAMAWHSWYRAVHGCGRRLLGRLLSAPGRGERRLKRGLPATGETPGGSPVN